MLGYRDRSTWTDEAADPGARRADRARLPYQRTHQLPDTGLALARLELPIGIRADCSGSLRFQPLRSVEPFYSRLLFQPHPLCPLRPLSRLQRLQCNHYHGDAPLLVRTKTLPRITSGRLVVPVRLLPSSFTELHLGEESFSPRSAKRSIWSNGYVTLALDDSLLQRPPY